MRSFSITTPVPSIRMDASRQGTCAFAVTNALERPMRGRATLQPMGATKPEWLSLTGPDERAFAAGETHQFSVKLALPPEAPAGSYPFQLVVVNVDNPDEDYTAGPTISFEAPAAAQPVKRKPFPWWIPAAAAAVVLLIVVMVVALRNRGPAEEEGTGGSGQPTAEAIITSPDFDGANSFVDLGAPGRLNFPDEITLEAWVRPKAVDGIRPIIHHGIEATAAVLRIRNGKYEVGSPDNGASLASSPVPDEDVGRWVHLAGVYDGSQWILYRNGQQVASEPDATGALLSTETWALGAQGNGVGGHFKGQLRDVRVWRLPRTAQEVQADMKTELTGTELGLAGWWKLGEGQGTSVRDSSRNQNHGTLRHSAWLTPTTPRYLEFNGTSTFVDLGNPPRLNVAGPLTLEAWMRPRTLGPLQNLIAHGYNDNATAEVFLRVVFGMYQAGAVGNGTGGAAFGTAPQADLGQWVHMAAVFDGASWILYRNGEQFAAMASAANSVVGMDKPWAIGARGGGGERFFNGSLREVRIWQGARSPQQIQAEMNSTLRGDEPGLLGYWPLNEGEGTTAKDLSRNQNHGTIKDPLW